ncbi:MAG: mechanosensitive ion channel [Bacteroidota bacterium]|nr:mechanosensitive ion channel [Bacteroidota bacterium]
MLEFDLNTIASLKNQAIELSFLVIPKALLGLVTYLAGYFIIKILIKSLTKLFEKMEIETSLSVFLTSFTKVLLYILLFLAIAQTLGIEATSFLAILGAAGLAVGLALQGSLANFAGGVLILIFKPFKVGDTIEAQSTFGVVDKIEILYTKIKNLDNKLVIIPNGSLANSNITNYTVNPTRRIEMKVGVAYGTDLKKTRMVILEALKKDARIHAEPDSTVFFSSFGDSSLDLIVRCWANSEDYLAIYFDSMEAIKEAFEAHEIQVPFPQRDVHMFNHQIIKNNEIIKEGIAINLPEKV